jgi:nucleoside-diphosphate-sugar epimerase
MPVGDNTLLSTGRSVLVTGSSGFIGAHLHHALRNTKGVRSLSGLDIVEGNESSRAETIKADIRRSIDLKLVAEIAQPHTIFHLAAVAEVAIPVNGFAELFETNVLGTLNVLQILKPKVVLSASTSAIYGNSLASGGQPSWNAVRPVGVYGMSKAVVEMIGRDWARETGNVFLHFRFGNVVGPNSRGLIPYLVDHALKHPDGNTPARLRGQGKVQRDYVPVDYVLELMIAAMHMDWAPGTNETFNVGTGRVTTNGEVARIVQRILKKQGHELSMTFDSPLLPGESQRVVLDMTRTVKKLGLPVPPRSAVTRAIEQATISHLNGARRSVSAR